MRAHAGHVIRKGPGKTGVRLRKRTDEKRESILFRVFFCGVFSNVRSRPCINDAAGLQAFQAYAWLRIEAGSLRYPLPYRQKLPLFTMCRPPKNFQGFSWVRFNKGKMLASRFQDDMQNDAIEPLPLCIAPTSFDRSQNIALIPTLARS